MAQPEVQQCSVEGCGLAARFGWAGGRGGAGGTGPIFCAMHRQAGMMASLPVDAQAARLFWSPCTDAFDALGRHIAAFGHLQSSPRGAVHGNRPQARRTSPRPATPPLRARRSSDVQADLQQQRAPSPIAQPAAPWPQLYDRGVGPPDSPIAGERQSQPGLGSPVTVSGRALGADAAGTGGAGANLAAGAMPRGTGNQRVEELQVRVSRGSTRTAAWTWERASGGRGGRGRGPRGDSRCGHVSEPRHYASGPLPRRVPQGGGSGDDSSGRGSSCSSGSGTLHHSDARFERRARSGGNSSSAAAGKPPHQPSMSANLHRHPAECGAPAAAAAPGVQTPSMSPTYHPYPHAWPMPHMQYQPPQHTYPPFQQGFYYPYPPSMMAYPHWPPPPPPMPSPYSGYGMGMQQRPPALGQSPRHHATSKPQSQAAGASPSSASAPPPANSNSSRDAGASERETPRSSRSAASAAGQLYNFASLIVAADAMSAMPAAQQQQQQAGGRAKRQSVEEQFQRSQRRTHGDRSTAHARDAEQQLLQQQQPEQQDAEAAAAAATLTAVAAMDCHDDDGARQSSPERDGGA